MTMTTPMTSADLQRFIDLQRIQATILSLGVHTATVSDAARALDVADHQIIKSLVFMAHDQGLLVINNGTARVDRRRLAASLGIGRRRVKFASAEQALALTGYVVGSMPPFGHRQKLRTIVDPAVGRLDVVFGGGGDIDAMLKLTPAELLRVTAAEVREVSDRT